MKFASTVRHTDPKLVVSKRHDDWMVANPNATYSLEALKFAWEQLDATQRVRKATISASSLGNCIRQQQFTYLGMPQRAIEPRGAAIFHNGTFMHLRWQMAGITEGWLAQAEVPIPENEWGLSGTMDGILYEDSIVEFKSINDNGFRSVNTFGPQSKHLLQGAAYAMATNKDQVVFIYENKNDQEYREYVVGRDELPIEEAELRAEHIWSLNGRKELAEPLSKCEDREGFEYKYCPFRDVCLGTRSWADAVRKAG